MIYIINNFLIYHNFHIFHILPHKDFEVASRVIHNGFNPFIIEKISNRFFAWLCIRVRGVMFYIFGNRN